MNMQANFVFLTFGVLLGFLILLSTFASYLLIMVAPLGVLAILILPECYSKVTRLCQELRWWHYLWAFMFLSGLVFRIRDTSTMADSPLDPWALYRMFLMTLIGIVLVYQLVINRTDWIRSLSQGLPALLTGYAASCLISVTWSVYPTWSLYKSVEYLVDVSLLAAIVAMTKEVAKAKTLFNWTWLFLGLLLATVWFWVVVWPDEAVLRKVGLLGIQIHGVWPAMETNGVGEVAAVLGTVAFTRLLFANAKNRLFYSAALVFAFATLVFAQSRSPITAFIVSMVIVLFVSRRIGGLALASVAVIVVFSFTSASEPLWEYFQRGQKDREFESLSGRTELWNTALVLIQDQPLHGYGAYAGTRFTGITDAMGTGTSSILNTWLEVLLGVGVPGFLLLVIVFLQIWIILFRTAWHTPNDDLVHRLGVEALGVLAIISVRSMFSPQLIWHPPMTFLLVLGYAEFVRRLAKTKTYESPFSTQLLSAARR
jgi:O-antigen ligase